MPGKIWSLASVLLIVLYTRFVSAASPRALAWSSSTYGPDGPWQAVSIELGSNNQPVDLYPGNAWHSNILATSICSGISAPRCYPQVAGLYESSTSSSVSTFVVINTVEPVDWTAGAMSITGTHAQQFDTANVTLLFKYLISLCK